MLQKLFNKVYIFVFAVLFTGILIFLNRYMDIKSDILKFSLNLLIIAMIIVIFFDFMRALFTRDRGSYRTMLLERPVFNPRGKKDNLKLTYPLYPKFIAIYFDRSLDREKKEHLHSIQAVRYEKGYLTDSLFLPIKKDHGRNRKRDLTIEEAFKYLDTYCKDFPIVVHDLEYANSFMFVTSNTPLFMYAADTREIAGMIYPKLRSYEIEDINDYLHIEVNDTDAVYGAKLVAAVYLDYLRLHDYRTNVTLSPFGRKSDMKPVFPDHFKDDTRFEETESEEEMEEAYETDENVEIGDSEEDIVNDETMTSEDYAKLEEKIEESEEKQMVSDETSVFTKEDPDSTTVISGLDHLLPEDKNMTE